MVVGAQSWAQQLACDGHPVSTTEPWMGLNDFACGRPSSLLERGRHLDGRWQLHLRWADLGQGSVVTVCPPLSQEREGHWSPVVSPEGTPICQHPSELPANVIRRRRREAFALTLESECKGKEVSELLTHSRSLAHQSLGGG